MKKPHGLNTEIPIDTSVTDLARAQVEVLMRHNLPTVNTEFHDIEGCEGYRVYLTVTKVDA